MIRGKLNSGVELEFDEQDLVLWGQSGSWPRSLAGNVSDMSATCRQHATLSANVTDMGCLCRQHANNSLPKIYAYAQ